jgi:hypothetical protein
MCAAGSPVQVGTDLVENLAVDSSGVYWGYIGDFSKNFADGALRGPITNPKDLMLFVPLLNADHH